MTSILDEDEYRNRVGWKGEFDLFKRGIEQHKERTGHQLGDDSCETCEKFKKNFLRLMNEGNQLAEELARAKK